MLRAAGGRQLLPGRADVLQASEHIRKLPYVDEDRVALVGFSWGAMVAVLASSPHYAESLKAGPAFAAVVSFYPGCFRITPPNGLPAYEIVNSDINHPLLVLMGEADTETPAAECIEKLNAVKSKGAPIEWQVYPATTHCWDCQQLDGRSKVDVRGHQVVYRFSQATTDASEHQAFEFLGRVMPRRR
jgi:dienelactone hydrolase